MGSGYIKLHRKIKENPIFRDSTKLHLWVYCLVNASHTGHKTILGSREVFLQPGQFVTGRHRAATETGLTEKQVRAGLKALEILEMVKLHTSKGQAGTIVTICNWNLYQYRESENGQEAAKFGPSEGQVRATIQEGKEGKEKKYICDQPTKSNSREQFQKPTIEEVRSYCEERKNSVDPETFWNFYESKGWRVGKNKMQSWKACVHTWEKNERSSYGWRTEKAKESRKCSKCGSPWIQGQIECLQCGTRFS